MSDVCVKCGFDIDSQIAAVDELKAELEKCHQRVKDLMSLLIEVPNAFGSVDASWLDKKKEVLSTLHKAIGEVKE
mgnify:CR=1 FL=1